jgi:Ribbon-helix-helix protein, copG family
MSSTLARIEIRLPQAVKDRLTAEATARGSSVSEIGLAAILEFLGEMAPPKPGGLVEGFLPGLGRLEKLLEGLIRVFLTVGPDPQRLTEAERLAMAQRGDERWAQFQAVIEEGG